MKKNKNYLNNAECIICKSVQQKIFSYKKFTYYKCIVCKLVSTYPLPTNQIIKKHYTKQFRKGNYKLLKDFSAQYNIIYLDFIERLEKELQKNNKLLNNIKVLDIGCFTGNFLILMNKKGADVYGIELQKKAVELANKKLPGKIYEIDVMEGKFPPHKYDVITLLGVIEHVKDPLLLIDKSSKLLRKGGLLMIQTPNSSSFLAHTLKKFWPPYTPIEHIHIFGTESIKTALKKTGFEIISINPHWKRLPIKYVYEMLQIFGQEFHNILKPMEILIKKLPNNLFFPFYVGEMIIIAKKK